MANQSHSAVGYVGALAFLTMVSVSLFFFGAFRNHSLAYDYFNWNLFLAWLPLVFAAILRLILPHKAWLSFWPIIVSLLWLGFLPNSFYMISDYIHLQEVQRVDLVYDAVMFSAFIVTGLVLGLSSLYLVHEELRKRFSGKVVLSQVSFIILLCSFAIYLGRDLRWNTWDMLVNPAGLLFDVSDRFVHPAAHPEMFLITGSFFVLISGLYLTVWQAARFVQASHR